MDVAVATTAAARRRDPSTENIVRDDFAAHRRPSCLAV
jgi:hypothetical protein